MPKICEPCGYYSADNAAATCPTCQGSLKMTMLPPRGQAPAPLADVAPDAARPRSRHGREGFLAEHGISPKVAGIVVAVLVAAGLFAFKQYEKKARYDKVRPGMHISEVARLVDTGKGWHTPGMVRFRDRFAPDDTSSGTVTVEDGANELVIVWEKGIVTSAERRDRQNTGGMRRRSTTVTDDTVEQEEEDR